MSKSISIFGLGYVGAVTAACLASKGNKVIGVDPVAAKVQTLAEGRSPIVEASLEQLAAEGARAGLISATQDAERAILESEISFISVGTPSQRNGKLDLSHIENVCRDIGTALRRKSGFHWIVVRSTVLPGTTEEVVTPAIEEASGKRAMKDFGVCFNPEFLREGSAVADFYHPPFTIIGTSDGSSAAPVRALYEWAPAPMFETTTKTAEMIKYVCNCFHALKVGFANEMGALCVEMGVNPHCVMDIFKADTRLNISTTYLSPGFAFGGSCLPKDLRAVTYRGRELDLKLPLLESILPSNQAHIDRAVEDILRTGKRNIGVIGLSFKAGTDDLRESPMVLLVKRLVGEGCELKIWDKSVALGQLIGSNRQFIQDTIPHIGSLMCNDLKKVIEESAVVVIGTKAATREEILAHVRPEQIVVDVVEMTKPGYRSESKTVTA